MLICMQEVEAIQWNYVNRDGSWDETSVAETDKHVALPIYFELVKVSGGDVTKYWNTNTVSKAFEQGRYSLREQILGRPN
jgi:hypothetical protein